MVRVVRLERTASWSQTRRDTNFAIPGYSISVIIPRREGKSKIFLSVVNPVVKTAFVPLSAIGENPANAGATRLSGVSRYSVSDTATALPKQAPYQLGYTRIFACHDYSTKLMRLKVFCVCGHLCGQSGFSSCFDCREKSHKRPCCKGIQALAVPIVDRRSNAPKPGAIPTSLYPDIHFPAMIPRRGVKIKFFLSVAISGIGPIHLRSK